MRYAHPKLVLAVVVTVAAALPGAAWAGAKGDPAALAVAQRTLDAMGGAKAFESLRTLAFDFVVMRQGKEVARFRHVWDRWDGRYRVEAHDKEGKSRLAIFNVQKRGQGRAWRDGKELSGDDLKQALDNAYGRFINDSYWLLMPAKMLDPGVRLASEGVQEKDGKAYDVVRLTFDHVGLTPDDTYWAYVAKDTGLVERWEMVLTGQKPEDRAAYLWTDWKQVGPVRLSLSKPKAGDPSLAIRFDNVSGSTSPDDAAFQAP